MPKYRQLHTKILNSADFSDMPDDFTRLVWVLLPLILDCEGRGYDNKSWLKSNLFPFREDFDLCQIERAMAWFAEHEMIRRYSVAGRGYFYIPTWHNYQSGTDKEARSSIPTPDLLQSNSGANPRQEQVQEQIQEQQQAQEQDHGAPPDPFCAMQSLVERTTGYPMTQRDIKALNEFVTGDITEEDIKDAMAFLSPVKQVRGAADLRNSVFVAHGKRVQAGNNNNGHKQVAIDAHGNTVVIE